MALNITSIKTSSNGLWQGDNPLHYAFPLLIFQITLILVISRFLTLLLKPLRQPKVIAEIVGGILLGPSAFGRNEDYMHRIFPSWSTPILESVASIGLIFFLFLVGLELDLSSIRRSGKKAIVIAAAGISVPFIFGIGIAFVLRKTVDGADKVGYPQYLVFMGVALSITAFPVLARILAELKLLTTQLGETAMAAAAFNDVVAWILLALAIALSGDGAGGPHKSPLISLWILLSGIAFVISMMVAIRPAMKWVARRCTPDHDTVDEAYICLALAGVMVFAFFTDLIGIHAIFGAFVFGLTVPKGGEFAGRLIERIEDFVSGLLLPLYFASTGLKTDVAKIKGAEAWGLLVLVISTACAGKILGTFVVAKLCRFPARESFTLGLLMNTKGLVELIVLNIGKEKKVLNEEVFAILVLMALFTTFMTTPSVMAIYKPARGNSFGVRRKLQSLTGSVKDELRILACVHGPRDVPSLINLIELTRSATKSKLKLYIVRLVELTERSSSIVMVQRFRKNGFPFINRFRWGESHDRVAVAFQAYGQVNRVSVRHTTAISALSTIHEDICHVAEDKKVTMILLPFHKRWRKEEGGYEAENVGRDWIGVNQRVLENAPCSVALFVDRGFDGGCQQNPTVPTPTVGQWVCVVFFGGPDDREAVKLGGRMAEHSAVKVTVVRLVEKEGMESNAVMLRPSPNVPKERSCSLSTAITKCENQKELDDEAVAEFRRRCDGVAEYTEKVASNIMEAVLALGRSRDYNLIIVGKSCCPSRMVAERQAEHAELGPIGDLLASSEPGIVSSLLVIQHRGTVQTEEGSVSKMMQTEDCTITIVEPSSVV